MWREMRFYSCRVLCAKNFFSEQGVFCVRIFDQKLFFSNRGGVRAIFMGWRRENLNFEYLSRFLITFSQENLNCENLSQFFITFSRFDKPLSET